MKAFKIHSLMMVLGSMVLASCHTVKSNQHSLTSSSARLETRQQLVAGHTRQQNILEMRSLPSGFKDMRLGAFSVPRLACLKTGMIPTNHLQAARHSVTGIAPSLISGNTLATANRKVVPQPVRFISPSPSRYSASAGKWKNILLCIMLLGASILFFQLTLLVASSFLLFILQLLTGVAAAILFPIFLFQGLDIYQTFPPKKYLLLWAIILGYMAIDILLYTFLPVSATIGMLLITLGIIGAMALLESFFLFLSCHFPAHPEYGSPTH